MNYINFYIGTVIKIKKKESPENIIHNELYINSLISNCFFCIFEDVNYFYFAPTNIPKELNSFSDGEKYSDFCFKIPDPSKEILIFKELEETKIFVNFLKENLKCESYFDYVSLKYIS